MHAKQAEKRGPLAIPWRVTWRGMKIGHVVYPFAIELASGFLDLKVGFSKCMVTLLSTVNHGLEYLKHRTPWVIEMLAAREPQR